MQLLPSPGCCVDFKCQSSGKRREPGPTLLQSGHPLSCKTHGGGHAPGVGIVKALELLETGDASWGDGLRGCERKVVLSECDCPYSEDGAEASGGRAVRGWPSGPAL